jgi:choline kinase
MVQVGGRPILDHVLDFLDHPEIDEIAIVGGYKSGVIKRHVAKYTLRTVRFYFNPAFASEGSIRTIMTAEDFLDGDFIVLNADHIYPSRMLDAYISKQRGITIACDFDRSLVADDMKIKLDKNGLLTKIRKDLTEFDGGYIGSTFIPAEKVAAYKDALHASYDIYGKGSNAETVVGHLAANDHKISIADLSGFGWLEVDTQEDLARAEKEIVSSRFGEGGRRPAIPATL